MVIKVDAGQTVYLVMVLLGATRGRAAVWSQSESALEPESAVEPGSELEPDSFLEKDSHLEPDSP